MKHIALFDTAWCNGSMTAFDTVGESSSLSVVI